MVKDDILLEDLPDFGSVPPEPKRKPVPKKKRGEPPNSRDAEVGLIGCCLIDPEIFPRALAEGITAESFYHPGPVAAWEAMVAMGTESPDEFRLKDVLEKRGEDAGVQCVTEAAERVETSFQANAYIAAVREKAILRQFIRAAEECREMALNGDELNDVLAGGVARFQAIEQSAVQAGVKVQKLGELKLTRPDDPRVLLGVNRYLERGEGMMLVSSSGMGKSSIQLQAAACWALGRPFMGIKCNGPLRSLIVQAEDSEGDIAEVWESIKAAMELTKEEVRQAEGNICLIKERERRGTSFLGAMRGYVQRFPADLVWINPLQAYAGVDISKNEEVGAFVRSGLNAVNRSEKFAWIIVHHTNKPMPAKDARNSRQWNEEMYEMAGGAELINWARAIMVLRPTGNEGVFQLVLAKRGRRAGVVGDSEEGATDQHEIITRIPIKHSSGTVEVGDMEIPKVFWIPASPEEAAPPEPAKKAKPGDFTVEDVAEFVPGKFEDAKSLSEIGKITKGAIGIPGSRLVELVRQGRAEGIFAMSDKDHKYWRLSPGEKLEREDKRP